MKELFIEALKKYIIPRGILDRRNDINDQEIINKCYKYCLIMNTTEGLNDFLEYQGNETEYLKHKIKDLLGLEDTISQNNQKQIRDYLYDRVIKNGYVVHTTNSYYAQNIMNNGFQKTKTDNETTDILTELKSIFPETIFKTDLNFILNQKGERSGWYFDRSPHNYMRYSRGPEWFKRLTHGNYTINDYEASKRFIDSFEFESESHHKKAIELLNKYWNLFYNTTPHILLISTKDNDLRPQKEQKIDTDVPIEYQIQYLTDLYFRVNDNASQIDINPHQIIDIDIKQIYQDYLSESSQIKL